MPKKYNIPVKDVPPRNFPVGKFSTIEFREDCAGSCRNCVKKKCIYNIFDENYSHMRSMKAPEYIYQCYSCFRCVQECTKGIFSRVINPEYSSLGDELWTPQVITITWRQAHTGAIPVSGAGYRGPFTGEGFDGIWTDMSEIVRPTRDGIHGREYINTSIEVSRRPQGLKFNEDLSLDGDLPQILEIPLPILFKQPDHGVLTDDVICSMARAASQLGTLMIIEPEVITQAVSPYLKSLVPRLTRENHKNYQTLIQEVPMVELSYEKGIENEFAELRKINPQLCICVSIPLVANAVAIASEMAFFDVDTLHFYGTDQGKEKVPDNPRFLKDVMQDIHLELIDKALRQKVNLVFSGGIALSEHVTKSIICGADGVVIGRSLLIAMECRLCYRCNKDISCPAKLEEVDPDYGSSRIINLMAAWRNQMLEMMGAMGIREVRRLRGEMGRSMWFEDLEKEIFGSIFKQ
jgi:ferredoxin